MPPILIETRALAFASFAVNPECPRFHLRGVRVEYHDGRAVCIATDGIVLLFARSEYQTEPFEPFTLNFRKSSRLFACARKMGPMVSITFGPDGEAVWALVRMNGTVIERGFVELLAAEENYPEWRTLLPGNPIPKTATPVDIWPMSMRWICRAVENYSGDVDCTLRLVSPGPSRPTVILVPESPAVGGLVVPVSHKTDIEVVFPNWAMIEPQEPPSADNQPAENAA
ncbi:hypothetical protein HKD24_09170 [Gluconobacter sp. LMG 31484]|uniref:Uncharacterized protein n=1 Tax=Gluconobacter vitians TaxID=2728102 RepID=A0ABR9Y615_9PROT|nr:hypothetical protein [Gluconobacter vitians]MBF0859383.1 hypothetical protein [Gluconobacter vitians]